MSLSNRSVESHHEDHAKHMDHADILLTIFGPKRLFKDTASSRNSLINFHISTTTCPNLTKINVRCIKSTWLDGGILNKKIYLHNGNHVTRSNFEILTQMFLGSHVEKEIDIFLFLYRFKTYLFVFRWSTKVHRSCDICCTISASYIHYHYHVCLTKFLNLKH